VDAALWHAANVTMTSRARRGLRRTRHVYMLERLAVCGICGGEIWIHRTDSKGFAATYYNCVQRRRPSGARPRCTLPMMRTDVVDGGVWADVCAALLGDGLEARLRQRVAGRDDERHAWAGDLAAARRQLGELAERERVITDQFGRGRLRQDTYEASLAQMDRQRRLLEQQVGAAERALTGAPTEAEAREAGDLLRRLRSVLRATATPEERRDVLRALLTGHPHVAVLGPARGAWSVSLAVDLPGVGVVAVEASRAAR
jgi:ribosomal protein L32